MKKERLIKVHIRHEQSKTTREKKERGEKLEQGKVEKEREKERE